MCLVTGDLCISPLWPFVNMTGVPGWRWEVPPLEVRPVVQLLGLPAPVVHLRGQELVEQHAPGVRQLQQREQNPEQHLVPAANQDHWLHFIVSFYSRLETSQSDRLCRLWWLMSYLHSNWLASNHFKTDNKKLQTYFCHYEHYEHLWWQVVTLALSPSKASFVIWW